MNQTPEITAELRKLEKERNHHQLGQPENGNKRRQESRNRIARRIPWCGLCGKPINSIDISAHRFYRNIPKSARSRLAGLRTTVVVCLGCDHHLSKYAQDRKVEALRTNGELQSIEEKTENKTLFATALESAYQKLRKNDER